MGLLIRSNSSSLHYVGLKCWHVVLILTSTMAYFDDLCNKGAQSTPQTPQLHLGAPTCVCSLCLLSQFRPDNPNCNLQVNTLSLVITIKLVTFFKDRDNICYFEYIWKYTLMERHIYHIT